MAIPCLLRWLIPLALLCSFGIQPARALDLHGMPADAVAVWVAPVEGTQTDLAYRADVPLQPASTMKVLTSWVALDRLGPDFTWQTRLVSDAPVVDGVLQGDLYWVGQGDPHFFSDELSSLIAMLAQRGIHKIAGRLLMDMSAYSRISPAEGFDADAGRAFVVPPSPLLLNLNVAWLRFFNDAQGPRAVLMPALDGLHLQLRLQNDDADLSSCRDVGQFITVAVNDRVITVTGKLPKACDGAMTYVQTLPPDDFSAAGFLGQWRAIGGVGPVRVGLGTAPANARVLATVQSPPLGMILSDMNKFSSNPMTRSVFLTLGHTSPKTGDTVDDAIAVVQDTLNRHGINRDGLVLENGSGLSRIERLPVRLLGQVLQAAARGPYASELIASLPVAGERGTLHHRFVDLGPRLRLKTGTLNNVIALAGYWQKPDGQRLVIVAVVNSPNAQRHEVALNQIVQDVIRQFGDAGV